MIENYSELVVEVLAEWEEPASAVLFEAGASGVEIRDEATVALTKDFPRNEGAILVLGYFENYDALDKIDFVAKALGPDNLLRIEARRGQQIDWVQRFKEYFHPIKIGESIMILPTWIQPTIEQLKELLVIRIDPGPAFGTGQHATTALVLEYLEQLAQKGELSGKMLDVGCGSGILGIAGCMLGMEGCIGVEIDPEARVWARRNIALNNLARKVIVSQKQLGQIRSTYPLVVANIHTSVLTQIMGDLVQRMDKAKGSRLILSGVLKEEEATIVSCAKQYKLKLISKKEKGEWLGLLFGL